MSTSFMIRRRFSRALSLVAIGVPMLIASFPLTVRADDQSFEGYDLPTAAPALPNVELTDPTIAAPQAAMPQATLATNILPGGNPFQATPTVSAVPSAITIVSANPFGPSGAGTVTNVPDAAPFGMLPAAPTATVEGAAPAAAQPTDGIDVTALRYYASQRDMARVGAEIRRLKSLYPSWEPPTDLFVEQSSVDEQPLWALFAQGQYAAERASIADLKVLNPTWTPSADLLAKLGDAEARQAMKVAYNLGNWEQVIAVAQGRNTVLVCSQIEAIWQLGEALARVGNYAMSFELYKYALTNCNDSGDRLATMQKAALVMPLPGVRALVLLGRPLPDGTSEFDSIAFNDLRHRLNAAINDSLDADPVDPSEMERFAAYVRVTRNADDVGLIGWYYYSLEEWDAARAWFNFGSKLNRDPKFIEGQLLALRSAGDLDAALKLGDAAKGRSPELTKEYIELVAAILTDPDSETEFTDKQIDAFGEVVTKAKSALGAQAIGWTYVADNELAEASDWFDTSVDWEVTEGGIIGQAVIASRLKQYKTLSALKAAYTDEYHDLSKFKIYTVKTKAKAKTQAKAVTKASVECGDGARTLIALFACPR